MQQQQQQQQQQILQMQQIQTQQQSTTTQSSETSGSQTSQPAAESTVEKVDDMKFLPFCTDLNSADKKEAGKLEKKFGFPLSQPPNYTITDCKCLVRTLICAIKSATYACIKPQKLTSKLLYFLSHTFFLLLSFRFFSYLDMCVYFKRLGGDFSLSKSLILMNTREQQTHT